MNLTVLTRPNPTPEAQARRAQAWRALESRVKVVLAYLPDRAPIFEALLPQVLALHGFDAMPLRFTNTAGRGLRAHLALLQHDPVEGLKQRAVGPRRGIVFATWELWLPQDVALVTVARRPCASGLYVERSGARAAAASYARRPARASGFPDVLEPAMSHDDLGKRVTAIYRSARTADGCVQRGPWPATRRIRDTAWPLSVENFVRRSPPSVEAFVRTRIPHDGP